MLDFRGCNPFLNRFFVWQIYGPKNLQKKNDIRIHVWFGEFTRGLSKKSVEALNIAVAFLGFA